MDVKQILREMKAGETKNFSGNPCYPVLVEKIDADTFRMADGSLCSFPNAVRRLRPMCDD